MARVNTPYSIFLHWLYSHTPPILNDLDIDDRYFSRFLDRVVQSVLLIERCGVVEQFSFLFLSFALLACITAVSDLLSLWFLMLGNSLT